MINNFPIQPDSIARGSILPEPLRIIMVEPLGSLWKIGGVSLHTGQYHERVLDKSQISILQILPAQEPMDGNPESFV